MLLYFILALMDLFHHKNVFLSKQETVHPVSDALPDTPKLNGMQPLLMFLNQSVETIYSDHYKQTASVLFYYYYWILLTVLCMYSIIQTHYNLHH